MVIFVSHKLEEIEQLCDRVTVMRAGTVVGREDLPVLAERLVELMFGKVVVIADRAPATLGDTVLQLDNVLFSDRIDVGELSIGVAEAEVVGLAGMEGSGQRTFLRGCAGLVAADHGTITVDGVDLSRAALRRVPGGRGPPPARRAPRGGPRPRPDDHRALRARQRQPLVLRRLEGGGVDRRRANRQRFDQGHHRVDRRLALRRQPATPAVGDAARAAPPAPPRAPDSRARHRVRGVGVVAAARTTHRRYGHRLRVRPTSTSCCATATASPCSSAVVSSMSSTLRRPIPRRLAT